MALGEAGSKVAFNRLRTDIHPCTFVIFGATGNLSRNKLLPALYHLEQAGRLPERMTILAHGRPEWSDEQWCQEVAQVLAPKARKGLDEKLFARFSQRLSYLHGDLNDTDTYRRLKGMLEQGERFPGNHVFYMAIRPAEFGMVSDHLVASELTQEQCGWCRLVIEKSFGYDLESAHILQDRLHRNFREDQLFRC